MVVFIIILFHITLFCFLLFRLFPPMASRPIAEREDHAKAKRKEITKAGHEAEVIRGGERLVLLLTGWI